MMKKIVLLLAIAICVSLPTFAEQRTFNSPDGKIVVTVSDQEGKPSYKVTYDGVEFILNSPLGLKTNIGDFTEGMKMLPEKVAPRLL